MEKDKKVRGRTRKRSSVLVRKIRSVKKRQKGERKRDRIKLVDRTRTTPVVVEDQILSADPFLFLLLKISPRFFFVR